MIRLLLFCVFVLPLVQPAPLLAQSAAIPISLIDKGGLFFPGPAPDTVLPAQQVEADVAIRIDGVLARAVIRQHYRNPTDVWAEALYVFPLPENAAVDHLRLDIDGRVIAGRIEARAAAEQRFEAAAAAGQAASLLTQARANIFTNRVANIPPGGEIAVEIGFDLPVDYDAGVFSMTFPMVVNPRYQPDGDGPTLVARRSAPPPTAAYDVSGRGGLNPVRLAVALNAGFAVGRLTSPSHGIEAMTAADGMTTRVLLADGPVPADRDFVLRWQPDCLRLADAAPDRDCSGPFVAHYRQQESGAVYHKLMVVPDEEIEAAAVPPRDLVFIIDVSGSMGGEPILQAKKALSLALSRLRPADRLQVIAFDDKLYPLFPGLRFARQDSLGEALGWVAGLEANGGTVMRPALAAALSLPAAPDRLRQIVFLTDGAVGNDIELLGLVEAALGSARLFTVALGSAPNGFFMREAAEVGRGAMVSIPDMADVADAMNGLFAKLERPALTDLRLTGADGQPVATYPARLPDLYAGRPLTAVFRREGNAGPVTLSGRRLGQPWTQRLELDQGADAESVARLWGRGRLAALERQLRLTPNPDPLRAAALETALDYGLLSKYTALIAVDPRPIREVGEALAKAPAVLNFPKGTHQAFARVTGLPATATASILHLIFGIALIAAAGMVLWRRA